MSRAVSTTWKRRKYGPDVTRVLAFDLETSNLKGNMGNILVACAKWVGSDEFALSMRIDEIKTYGKTAESYCNDKPIVQKLIELINESQATLAHYGERFDAPFLTTRALVHGLMPPAPVKLIDTWRYAYKRLALTSNRLDTISHALKCQHTKYKLPLDAWLLAMHGHKPTLKSMQEYCQNDVDTLIDVYLAMRPIINDHPNVTGASSRKGATPACPACLKRPRRVQAQGFRMTKCFRIQRWQCQNCGTWFPGKQEKI